MADRSSVPSAPDRPGELVLRGGTVVDRTGSRRADVRVVEGTVAEVAEGIAPGPGATVLDAGGCLVTPGFVDLHTHLREPGREEGEKADHQQASAVAGLAVERHPGGGQLVHLLQLVAGQPMRRVAGQHLAQRRPGAAQVQGRPADRRGDRPGLAGAVAEARRGARQEADEAAANVTHENPRRRPTPPE